jgi:hypothetical protein
VLVEPSPVMNATRRTHLDPDPVVEAADDTPTYLETHATAFVLQLLALCDELEEED